MELSTLTQARACLGTLAVSFLLGLQVADLSNVVSMFTSTYSGHYSQSEMGLFFFGRALCISVMLERWGIQTAGVAL